MRKISLLLLVTLIFALPGVGFLPTLAANCTNSYATEFDPTTLPATGRIAQSFSTLRSSVAGAAIARVLADAEFEATNQVCGANGLSWVYITYTSGVTDTGASAVGLMGWALESQTYYDGTYGPGRWLTTGDGGPVSGTCEYSYATNFESGTGTGEIAEVFSTLRTSPGAFPGTRVMAPAEFTVNSQGCFGGFSWLNITYTSGFDEFGNSVAQQTGWALESQIYFDGTYGPGTWLIPTAAEEAS